MIKWTGVVLAVLIGTSSCSIIPKTPKTEFIDGFYVQKITHKKQVVYVDIEEDVLNIYPARKKSHEKTVDTSQRFYMYPKELSREIKYPVYFDKYSFDLDVLTIPLKFRLSQTGVPPQLNTNLNGAFYFGFRTDRYVVNYVKSPLKKAERNISHYGFSVGVFTGIGNTAMNPTTANNNIAIEYDGIVWNKGIAGIIAVNNLTFGLSVGVDHLLDQHRTSWIYQTKPWLGLAIGLNLN